MMNRRFLSWLIHGKFVICLLVVNCALGQAAEVDLPEPPEEILKAEQARIEAMAKATRSTIGVFGTNGQGGGSGVIISPDGYALTNYHVTDPFGRRMRAGTSDGEMYEAILVGIDPTGDLALIKLFGRDDFPYAEIGDSNQVRAGDWCFAAGNPFVLATNLQPTVTWGIVSGVNRYQYPAGTILEYTDCIQTDAAINPGNSGGPLYNAQGELIGINGRCSFEKRGRVNVGVGYAISIQQAMLFLGHLRSGRIVDHATLGFTVASDKDRKVQVSNILESSDAYRRGIRYGDEIVSLAGRPTRTVNELKNILGIFPSYSRLPIQYRRGNETYSTWVRVVPLHTAAELDEIINGKPVERSSRPRRTPQQDSEEKPQAPPAKPLVAKDDPLYDRFEARSGFGNYYFNRLELDRITRQIDPQFLKTRGGDGSSEEGASGDGAVRVGFVWDWKTKLAGESTTVDIIDSGKSIESRFGDQYATIDDTRGWLKLIESQTLHGTALGLKLWRNWHEQGPKNLGAATYIGTSQVVGVDFLCDLTHVTIGEIEVYFYTDPNSGDIRLIEMEANSRTDRLEVYFDDYQSVSLSEQVAAPESQTRIPLRMRVGYGPEPRFIAIVEGLEIKPKAASVLIPGGDL